MTTPTQKLGNYGTPSLVSLGLEYGDDSGGRAAVRLPLAIQQWQQAILDLSGEPANFDSDNLLTNEWSTAQPLDVFYEETGEPRGSYIGLGAFQNFTYAGALNVAQAIVLDVRPANIAYFIMMIDLLQRCPTPDMFISHLFCRPNCHPLTGSWTTTPTPEDTLEFLQRLQEASFDHAFMEERTHELQHLASLLIDDRFSTYISPVWAAAFMRFCVESFARFGVDLTYITWGLGITSRHPRMDHLIQTRSPNHQRPTFFLSPVLYARVRALALNWQIIPVIGDLGDPEWAERFAAWGSHIPPIRAVYTSNVEYYLVTRGSWASYDAFISTLKRLPVSDNAILIKAFFQYASERHPWQDDKYHDCVFAQSISEAIRMYEAGDLKEALDVYLKIPYIAPQP